MTEEVVENKAIHVADDQKLDVVTRGLGEEHGDGTETTKRGREGALVDEDQDLPGKLARTNVSGVQRAPSPLPDQMSGDPFPLHHSIGTALRSLEELNRLKDLALLDPATVQRSLHLGEPGRMLPAGDLVTAVHGLVCNVLPGFLRDLDDLLASVSARYGVAPLQMQQAVSRQAILRHMVDSPRLPEPLVPAVPELSREALLSKYGPPVAVIEKKMSNREYMSRFRLNTKFVSELLPAYNHATSVPTIYGALARLLCAEIKICTADGRPYKVVYELARTVKNDWLHHRFTTGWAEVVKELGIEIGDLLVFERWTDDRTLLTMQILKEHQLYEESPQYAWYSRPMSVAERKGQF